MKSHYWENLQPFVEDERSAEPVEFDRLRNIVPRRTERTPGGSPAQRAGGHRIEAAGACPTTTQIWQRSSRSSDARGGSDLARPGGSDPGRSGIASGPAPGDILRPMIFPRVLFSCAVIAMAPALAAAQGAGFADLDRSPPSRRTRSAQGGGVVSHALRCDGHSRGRRPSHARPHPADLSAQRDAETQPGQRARP